jgi:hypothetical protein
MGFLVQATCFNAYRLDREMCDCDQRRSLAKATIEGVLETVKRYTNGLSERNMAREDLSTAHEAV